MNEGFGRAGKALLVEMLATDRILRKVVV